MESTGASTNTSALRKWQLLREDERKDITTDKPKQSSEKMSTCYEESVQFIKSVYYICTVQGLPSTLYFLGYLLHLKEQNIHRNLSHRGRKVKGQRFFSTCYHYRPHAEKCLTRNQIYMGII